MRVRVRTVRRDKAVWYIWTYGPIFEELSFSSGWEPTLKLCRPTYFETLQAPDGQLCRCLHYIRGTQWMCQSTLKRCRPTYFETLQAPDGQLCRCLTFYIPRTWCATGNFKVGNSLPPWYIPVHGVYGSLVGHRWSTL